MVPAKIRSGERKRDTRAHFASQFCLSSTLSQRPRDDYAERTVLEKRGTVGGSGRSKIADKFFANLLRDGALRTLVAASVLPRWRVGVQRVRVENSNFGEGDGVALRIHWSRAVHLATTQPLEHQFSIIT